MDLPSCPSCVEIRESPIHGLGVFAKEDIAPNFCIGPFEGIEYSLKEFKTLYGKDTRYTYQLGRLNKILSAKEKRNWITYMNEGAPINCVLKKRACWSSTAILKGQELFLHYDKKGIIKYPRDY